VSSLQLSGLPWLAGVKVLEWIHLGRSKCALY
jgi:hypothetical protein